MTTFVFRASDNGELAQLFPLAIGDNFSEFLPVVPGDDDTAILCDFEDILRARIEQFYPHAFPLSDQERIEEIPIFFDDENGKTYKGYLAIRR